MKTLSLNVHSIANDIKSDYQWDTTDPVDGEKLEDEWFNAKFSDLIMELATKVSILAYLSSLPLA